MRKEVLDKPQHFFVRRCDAHLGLARHKQVGRPNKEGNRFGWHRSGINPLVGITPLPALDLYRTRFLQILYDLVANTLMMIGRSAATSCSSLSIPPGSSALERDEKHLVHGLEVVIDKLLPHAC